MGIGGLTLVVDVDVSVVAVVAVVAMVVLVLLLLPLLVVVVVVVGVVVVVVQIRKPFQQLVRTWTTPAMLQASAAMLRVGQPSLTSPAVG